METVSRVEKDENEMYVVDAGVFENTPLPGTSVTHTGPTLTLKI